MNNLGSNLLESPTAAPVVFSWDRQLNTKLHQFLIVTPDYVHVSALLSGRLSSKLVEALNGSGDDLTKQLKKGTNGKPISLRRSEITSIAWIEGHKRIEVEAAGKKTVLTFDDSEAMHAVASGLVPALGDGVRSTEEVSSSDQLKLAAPTALAAVLFAAVIVALDLIASEDYVATGSRRALKELINDAMVATPALVVWCVAAALVVGSIMYVMSQMKSSVERIRVSYAASGAT